ncbi:TetR/AcrR family transcriptional regulator [Caldimonas tepidiphila]|uniref:TetR/AcrR family transcriptional regulator n=1 Tax=Caldimonas tepidiphila TaxID=2315841 RepID=UPI000E5BFBE1|nr:TetR/AcrR family transcriptional regulator [Caldimonas tepidiphila]
MHTKIMSQDAALPTPERSPPPARPGRREQSKLDKRRRIMDAAKAVFVEHGYEAATTREIATRAEVSIGTVFVYAKDKRDLLLSIVNDELDAITAEGRAVLESPGPLLERLGALFELRYRYWASEPRLSRPAVRETFDFLGREGGEQGEETRRFYARRAVIHEQLVALVRDAQRQGEVDPGVPPERAASLFLGIYLIEVRRWLQDERPQAGEGLARLHELLELCMRGLLNRPPPRAR